MGFLRQTAGGLSLLLFLVCPVRSWAQAWMVRAHDSHGSTTGRVGPGLSRNGNGTSRGGCELVRSY
jgi:hypothetical protein